MPIEFQLPERPAGFALCSGAEGEHGYAQMGAICPATDPALVQQRLDGLYESVFRHIPNFDPSKISHALVLIRHDLSATAYVDELRPKAMAKTTRAVNEGDPVLTTDVSEITEVDFGVEVPDDVAVVNYMSAFWKRSVYFDFFPLIADPQPRIGPLKGVAAIQLMSLWGLKEKLEESLPKTIDPIGQMSEGFQSLRRLIADPNVTESQLQELLQENPWMFRGHYKKIERHTALDDKNIPDFTGVRVLDDCRDILELKLPSLRCVKRDGTLSADFHNAWDQTERYLDFVTRDSDYLLRQKRLKFENARAWLIVGSNWAEEALDQVRRKERGNSRIRLMTYDQLLEQALNVLTFVRAISVGDPSLGTEEPVRLGPKLE